MSLYWLKSQLGVVISKDYRTSQLQLLRTPKLTNAVGILQTKGLHISGFVYKSFVSTSDKNKKKQKTNQCTKLNRISRKCR